MHKFLSEGVYHRPPTCWGESYMYSYYVHTHYRKVTDTVTKNTPTFSQNKWLTRTVNPRGPAVTCLTNTHPNPKQRADRACDKDVQCRPQKQVHTHRLYSCLYKCMLQWLTYSTLGWMVWHEKFTVCDCVYTSTMYYSVTINHIGLYVYEHVQRTNFTQITLDEWSVLTARETIDRYTPCVLCGTWI